MLRLTSYLIAILFAFGALVLSSTGSIAYAQEALLYLSPASAVVTIGDEFTVSVLLDTGGKRINAAEGAITFREEDLTVVSLSTQGAIFGSWVEAPSYVPNSGRISFAGSTGLAGYSGADGMVLQITFRALRNTASQVWFSQGAAVLSADGRADNVLSQLRSGTYTLSAREVVPSLAQVSPAVLGDSTERTLLGSQQETANPILSATHGTQDGWYSTSTAFLRWELPNDILSVRTGISTDRTARPTRTHEELITELIVPNLPEGTSYATLQFQTSSGWGKVHQYRLNTDLTPPEQLMFEEQLREDLTDPLVRFELSATDALSGIASYATSLNAGRRETIVPEGSEIELTFETPGTHTLRVFAIDAAGNEVSTSTSVTIEALPTPELTYAPETAQEGSAITLRGNATQGTTVVATVRYNNGEAYERTAVADATGAFALTIVDEAKEGTYETVVIARDERGAQSIASPAIQTTVTQPKLLLFGTIAVSYMSIIATLVGSVVLLLAMIWLMVWMVRGVRRRAKHESIEAVEVTHRAFEDLKHDARSLVRALTRASQKRPLTEEEERVISTMQQHLEEAEQNIEKEIRDIEGTTSMEPPHRVVVQKIAHVTRGN